jgi:hypothetical protein
VPPGVLRSYLKKQLSNGDERDDFALVPFAASRANQSIWLSISLIACGKFSEFKVNNRGFPLFFWLVIRDKMVCAAVISLSVKSR